jgi:hypothetical protein
MKKVVVYFCLLLIGTGMVVIFWKQELVYALPTPVPSGFQPKEIGQELILPFNKNNQDKPLFVHFFNPACPCSRFNMKHFRTLIHKYGKQIDFIVVVQTKDPDLSVEKVREKFNLEIPCVLDPGEKIAKLCGVYSTPQAVIVDAARKLYYRGNYNRARYCTDKKSDFAQIAIDSLLSTQNKPVFSALATRPYGCSLPSCK